MSDPAYPAARTAADRIRAHFLRHLAVAPLPGRESAVVPELASIEAIIEAAFWASLRREEGYMPRISLALLPPDLLERPLILERPLRLAASRSPGLLRRSSVRGIHLGVWPADGQLMVWGAMAVAGLFDGARGSGAGPLVVKIVAARRRKNCEVSPRCRATK